MDITDAGKKRVEEEEYKRVFRDQLVSRFNRFYDEKFSKRDSRRKLYETIYKILMVIALSSALTILATAISDYDKDPGWLKVDTGTHCVEYVMRGSNPNLKKCDFDTVDGEHCAVWFWQSDTISLTCEKQTPRPSND